MTSGTWQSVCSALQCGNSVSSAMAGGMEEVDTNRIVHSAAAPEDVYNIHKGLGFENKAKDVYRKTDDGDYNMNFVIGTFIFIVLVLLSIVNYIGFIRRRNVKIPYVPSLDIDSEEENEAHRVAV